MICWLIAEYLIATCRSACGALLVVQKHALTPCISHMYCDRRIVYTPRVHLPPTPCACHCSSCKSLRFYTQFALYWIFIHKGIQSIHARRRYGSLFGYFEIIDWGISSWVMDVLWCIWKLIKCYQAACSNLDQSTQHDQTTRTQVEEWVLFTTINQENL